MNIINGNKYQREVDMAALPGVLGLEIVRHYNSVYSGVNGSTNLLGRGWKLSYETELHVTATALQLVQADGTRIIFGRDPRQPSLCGSGDPADGSIEIIRRTRNEEYVWTMADGRKLSFDTKGKLVQVRHPGGEFLSLVYDRAGLLLSVTDPQGRNLRLNYVRRHGGSLRLKLRGVDGAVLVAWDVEKYVSVEGWKPDAGDSGFHYHMVGGDFREDKVFNGKIVEPGWERKPPAASDSARKANNTGEN